DVCSTLLATLGAWKLGIFDVSPSGERVKPDFMIDVMTCQSLAKTGQIWAERYGVPSFIIEFVPTSNCSDYLVSQMFDAIEWMERVTGRKYQDDLLIQAVRNEWHVRVLWSQIIELQKAIPAPLDARQLFSLDSAMWRGGLHRKEMVEVYQMVLDEMRERVRDKIAALGTERCRLMHEGIWTWYDTDIAKYPRKYGATFVGSDSMFCAEGVYEVGEDGSYKIGPTLEGRGLELRTREDALQALAELYTRWNPTPSGYYLDNRIKRGVKAAEDWHADAVVINFDQGCKGMTAGLTEMALALKKKGIPTLFYQANAANPTDFDEGEYQSRMDAFLESLGLRPLE
ncbi:MAG: 2-hydroxyacyl-CoA dehydratase, partial [Chloroflexi bacterium]|nr:2-hydroxyacyl-CoA dehydratase [Chloroflexota bacterium]